MTRETITGVLHVILTHKSRMRNPGALDRVIESALIESGRLPPLYYPPTYYVKTGETVDERRRLHGLETKLWGADRPFAFRFKGRPKVLDPSLRGHLVTVKTTVEPWRNGLGGYLIRPEVLDVGDYVECPHHEDPPGEYVKGSSRVYCTAPIADRAYPLPVGST